MNKDDVFIDSVNSLKDKLKEQHSIDVKPALVKDVLKRDLRMSYRLVKPISWFENSVKSKILRQQFALAFLEIDLGKKVILNIDETALGQSDFRRCKWRPHRHSNSVAQLAVAPRVSMIVGLDTLGEIYASVLQANTSGDIMILFFKHLIRQLDE